MAILSILILPVHKHEIPFHFIGVFSTSYDFNVLQCSVYRSFISSVKFIPKYFTIVDAIMNGIFKIFSDSLCSCIEIQLIFNIDFVSCTNLLKSLRVLTVFVEPLGFAMYKIMSSPNRLFYFIIFCLDAFYIFLLNA